MKAITFHIKTEKRKAVTSFFFFLILTMIVLLIQSVSVDAQTSNSSFSNSGLSQESYHFPVSFPFVGPNPVGPSPAPIQTVNLAAIDSYIKDQILITNSPPTPYASSLYSRDYGVLCDGQTDDKDNLRKAILAAAEAKKILIIGEKNQSCNIGGDLIVPSNSQILLHATLVAYRNFGQDPMTVFHIPVNSTNIVIGGDGQIEGNAALVSASIGNSGFGVSVGPGSSSVWITGLTIRNTRNSPVTFDAAHHVFMSNLTISESGPYGHSVQFSNGSYDCWADKIKVTGIHDGGFTFWGGVHECGISNSTSSASFVTGFGVDDDYGSPQQSYNIIMADNISYGNQSYGYKPDGMGANHGGPGSPIHNVIPPTGVARIRNTSYGNNSGGYHIVNGSNFLLADCDISGDLGPGSASGVYVGATNVKIIGCKISNESQGHIPGSGLGGIGINLIPGAANVEISGNQIFNTENNGSMQYGIYGHEASGQILKDNSISKIPVPVDLK